MEIEGKNTLEDIPEWTLYMNKSSMKKRSGIQIVLITLDKIPLCSAIQFSFKVSNNEAKYEALLVDLCLAKELRVQKLGIFSDSQLVLSQVLGDFQAREKNMNAYL